MADSLDYCEVVHSLCDVCSLVYSKFLDESCTPSTIHEAILKIDRKIKTLVVGKITQVKKNNQSIITIWSFITYLL